jgi:hypothetical protein
MSPTKKTAKPKVKAAPKKPVRAPAARTDTKAEAARKRAPEPAEARAKEKDARKAAAKPARKEPAPPARKPTGRAAAARGVPGGTRADLGQKFLCFQCNAKFYDLNKPEPVCPKCGADQRHRPKADAKAKPSAPSGQRRPVTRPMVPLLDDEDEDDVIVDEELDLGLDGVEESPEDFTEEEEPEEEESGDS